MLLLVTTLIVASGSLGAREEVPVTSTASAPFVLGVNEGVSVPRRLLDRGLADDALARMLRDDARALVALGATHVRAHTGAFPRTSMSELDATSQAQADLWLRVVQEVGLVPVMMVSPWPANRTREATPTYLPADLDAFEAYVRAQVERYDGDGVADMPGLRGPVRHWEVDNEPDLKHRGHPRGAGRSAGRENDDFCAPEQYAKVLVAAARGIRAASSEARVLAPGLFAPDRESAYLDAVLAMPGARAAIDVASLHTYAEDGGERLVASIVAVRARLPDVPIWVTETSASSEHDEERQARLVVALVARSAEAGASALFWHTLADPPPAVRAQARGLVHNSLYEVTTPGALREKPAAAVYRRLTEVLRAHPVRRAVAEGEGLTRLDDGSVLLWQGERPASGGGMDLRTGKVLQAGATARAPAWLQREP